MSRDAKVGLVIIFSFVFLLGTILLHRFHLTTGDRVAESKEPVVSESDSDTPLAENGTSFPLGENGVPATAVDGLLADTLPSRSQPTMTQPRDSGFGDGQRSRRTPNLSRPPTELPASQADGALISLTEAETYQQPAAVVESTGSAIRQSRADSGRQTGIADRRDPAETHASPLLDIHTPPHETDRGNPVGQRTDSNDTAADSSEMAHGNHDSGRIEDLIGVASDARGTDENSLSSNQPDNSAPLTRSLPSRSQRDPFELAEDDEIQQTEGKGKLERGPETPPPLPRYGSSAQPTIESLPGRPTRSDHDTNPSTPSSPTRSLPMNRTVPEESASIEDSSSAMQRAYVVKEGDSFWSISAKQYGTGKYFRALEEFNRHRLAAYEEGRRVLRPGTEILLPHASVLQSKSATPKQNNAAPPVGEKDGFRARQGADLSQERDFRDPQRSAPDRVDSRSTHGAAPRIYRVQEGDTLSKISQRELGTSKRWQEIYELNEDKLVNERSLKIGMELKLPADPSAEKLVDRPYGGR
jgi:nucleoid-associated protein YgaU